MKCDAFEITENDFKWNERFSFLDLSDYSFVIVGAYQVDLWTVHYSFRLYKYATMFLCQIHLSTTKWKKKKAKYNALK